MKIESIISQDRRDLRAIYRCEHCDATVEKTGYDDAYFHNTVIPAMECGSCGKKAADTYRPLATKYPDYQEV